MSVVSPTRMEISLSALLRNFETVRSLVGTWRGVFAVIKADAYGHGAVRVAQLYREAGCGSFAVARLGEALELRRAG
ncbi:MAG: alanine racemase, partial [Fretibacterium sp.]|nr:alanine racemase [Fretibacterium sp.]